MAFSAAAVARATACGVALVTFLQLAELAAAVSPSSGGHSGAVSSGLAGSVEAHLKAGLPRDVVRAASAADNSPPASLLRSEATRAGVPKESLAQGAASANGVQEVQHRSRRSQTKEAIVVSDDGTARDEAGVLLEADTASENMESASAGSLLEVHSEAQSFPGGISMSAKDVVQKTTDIMMGTSGIIAEDYPYACICNKEGICAEDPMETACSQRVDSGNGSHRSAAPLCTLQSLALVLTSVLLSVMGA